MRKTDGDALLADTEDVLTSFRQELHTTVSDATPDAATHSEDCASNSRTVHHHSSATGYWRKVG